MSHQLRWGVIGLLTAALGAAITAVCIAAVASAGGQSAVPRSPTVTGAIHLDHHEVVAGRTVRGELVFENHSSTAKVLTRGCKVDGLYGIGLRAADGYLQVPGFGLVACRDQEMVARPGVTRYRFVLPATYMQCAQRVARQPPRGSRYGSPLCLRGSRGARDVMPPLPAGTYTALFFAAGGWRGPHVQSAELVVSGADDARGNRADEPRPRAASGS